MSVPSGLTAHFFRWRMSLCSGGSLTRPYKGVPVCACSSLLHIYTTAGFCGKSLHFIPGIQGFLPGREVPRNTWPPNVDFFRFLCRNTPKPPGKIVHLCLTFLGGIGRIDKVWCTLHSCFLVLRFMIAGIAPGKWYVTPLRRFICQLQTGRGGVPVGFYADFTPMRRDPRLPW